MLGDGPPVKRDLDQNPLHLDQQHARAAALRRPVLIRRWKVRT
jgi:hypothetical protein